MKQKEQGDFFADFAVNIHGISGCWLYYTKLGAKLQNRVEPDYRLSCGIGLVVGAYNDCGMDYTSVWPFVRHLDLKHITPENLMDDWVVYKASVFHIVKDYKGLALKQSELVSVSQLLIRKANDTRGAFCGKQFFEHRALSVAHNPD